MSEGADGADKEVERKRDARGQNGQKTNVFWIWEILVDDSTLISGSSS